jgi:hypothetical protein
MKAPAEINHRIYGDEEPAGQNSMMIPMVGVTRVEELSRNTGVAFDPSGRTG